MGEHTNGVTPSGAGETQGSGLAELRRRVEFQSLVAGLATGFIGVGADRIDEGLEHALEVIGRFAGVDRSVLCLFHDEALNWGISHEWHTEGLVPLAPLLSTVAPFPWTTDRFREHRTIHARTLSALPAEAEGERSLMESLGIRSIVLLPVWAGRRLVGFAAFASQDVEHEAWPPDLLALLELVGEMFVNTLERKRRGQALRASQSRYRCLADSGVIGITVSRRDGTILESNDVALGYVGMTREDLEAARVNWRDLTPEEWCETDLRALEELDRTGACPPWEKEVLRAGGGRTPMLIGVTRLSEDPETLLSVCLDITEQRRVEDELQRRNAFDRLISRLSTRFINVDAAAIDDTINEGLCEIGRVLEVDRCGVYQIFADDGSLRLTHGWAAIEPGPDLPPIDVLPMDEHPWWTEQLSAGRTIFVPDVGALPDSARADRALLAAHGVRTIVGVPMSLGGAPLGFVSFLNTRGPRNWSEAAVSMLRVLAEIVAHALERKRSDQRLRQINAILERRVRQRTAQLEASNSELEAFSYSVSHDLRAPLRSIDGFGEILLEEHADQLGAEGRALIERVRQAGKRMGELIDALLALSRISRTAVERLPVDLGALARDVIEDLRAASPDRSVEVDIAPGMHVRAHPGLLRTVLEHLLGNAWKFTSRRSHALVEVGTVRLDGETVYFVRDDGAGFDPAFSAKLFGPFQRLHGVTEFEGHGIGLATVQRIVQMHGGRVWAEGEVDEGATFYFTIPSTGGM